MALGYGCSSIGHSSDVSDGNLSNCGRSSLPMSPLRCRPAVWNQAPCLVGWVCSFGPSANSTVHSAAADNLLPSLRLARTGTRSKFLFVGFASGVQPTIQSRSPKEIMMRLCDIFVSTLHSFEHPFHLRRLPNSFQTDWRSGPKLLHFLGKIPVVLSIILFD